MHADSFSIPRPSRAGIVADKPASASGAFRAALASSLQNSAPPQSLGSQPVENFSDPPPAKDGSAPQSSENVSNQDQLLTPGSRESRRAGAFTFSRLVPKPRLNSGAKKDIHAASLASDWSAPMPSHLPRSSESPQPITDVQHVVILPLSPSTEIAAASLPTFLPPPPAERANAAPAALPSRFDASSSLSELSPEILPDSASRSMNPSTANPCLRPTSTLNHAIFDEMRGVAGLLSRMNSDRMVQITAENTGGADESAQSPGVSLDPRAGEIAAKVAPTAAPDAGREQFPASLGMSTSSDSSDTQAGLSPAPSNLFSRGIPPQRALSIQSAKLLKDFTPTTAATIKPNHTGTTLRVPSPSAAPTADSSLDLALPVLTTLSVRTAPPGIPHVTQTIHDANAVTSTSSKTVPSAFSGATCISGLHEGASTSAAPTAPKQASIAVTADPKANPNGLQNLPPNTMPLRDAAMHNQPPAAVEVAPLQLSNIGNATPWLPSLAANQSEIARTETQRSISSGGFVATNTTAPEDNAIDATSSSVSTSSAITQSKLGDKKLPAAASGGTLSNADSAAIVPSDPRGGFIFENHPFAAVFASAPVPPSPSNPAVAHAAPNLPKTHQVLDAVPLPDVTRSSMSANPNIDNSHLHFGIRTEAFGAVEVHTVVERSQVGVTVHADRELSRWFSSEVPSLDSGLNHNHLSLTALEFDNARSGVQTSSSFQQDQPRHPVTTPTLHSLGSPAAVDEAPPLTEPAIPEVMPSQQSVRTEHIHVSIHI